ncbi:MAG: D-alanyl-D-alanine carboxypeptidase family protein [Clostridia bacterium]|nr:D-alanyl-D-alanine carboxypeptidase family protein [Clostridia bacterium]
MQSRSGRSQKIRHSYTKIYALTAGLCAIVALVVAITTSQLGLIGKKTPTLPPASATPSEEQSTPAATPTPTPSATPSVETPSPSEPTVDPAITRIPMTEAALSATNPLLVVSPEHPFTPSNALDIVNMWAEKDTSKGQNNRLQFPGSSAPLNNEAFLALQQLQFALGAQHEGYCLFIKSSYSAVTQDGKMTCECSDKNLTDAGHSDHATGYAVDLRFYKKTDTGTTYSYLYDATVREVTKTLLAECAKYGWIQSWSENNLVQNGKQMIDQGHFRYVGIPHSLYITENGLTFDGYMKALKETNYMKPLQVTDSDTKTIYKIYFISAEDALNPAKGIPVPTGSSYKIQGNGADGFIVTLSEQTAE